MSFSTLTKYGAFLMLIIIGIFAMKWVNSQYKLPVVGDMIEGV